MNPDWHPGPSSPPFSAFDSEDEVRLLVKRFYDAMERLEPQLAGLHEQDGPGRVSEQARERFALFLIGWLGGPQHYMARHGHPRLRMRHGHLDVDTQLRDAWMRSMRAAMDEMNVQGELRTLLEARFFQVADFLRNVGD